MVTCNDARHPVDNILDGKDETFFATTGMYPQEIVVDLGRVRKIARISTTFGAEERSIICIAYHSHTISLSLSLRRFVLSSKWFLHALMSSVSLFKDVSKTNPQDLIRYWNVILRPRGDGDCKSILIRSTMSGLDS